MPETLIWYAILFQAIVAIGRGIRHRLPDIALPLFVLSSMCIAYALVEGNEGTAYRHRAHALFIFFVFAGGAHAARSASAKPRAAMARLRSSGARLSPSFARRSQSPGRAG